MAGKCGEMIETVLLAPEEAVPEVPDVEAPEPDDPEPEVPDVEELGQPASNIVAPPRLTAHIKKEKGRTTFTGLKPLREVGRNVIAGQQVTGMFHVLRLKLAQPVPVQP
jgi:hypothetical protein